MPKLKPGSVIVDLVDGSVHGDLDHCPREDLLESAQALLSLLPWVKHKGLWGIGKAYDAGCYLYTTAKKYKPPTDLHLEAEMGYERKFSLKPIHEGPERYWRLTPWSRLVGGVQGDQVSPDTEGKTDHYLSPDPPRVPTPQARRQA